MNVSMNDGLDYNFNGQVDDQLIIDTWNAIVNQKSEETIDDLCDQWPCLAINGSVEEVREWLNELNHSGSVSGTEENLV